MYRHITRCEWFEGCSEEATDHAHTLKKTKITTREQWLDVAKLCRAHHNFAELGDKYNPSSHERMFELIRKCIATRTGTKI